MSIRALKAHAHVCIYIHIQHITHITSHMQHSILLLSYTHATYSTSPSHAATPKLARGK